MRVAYLLNIFPKISETFILNEILSVQSKGIRVEVFAFEDIHEDKVHPGVKDVKSITYIGKMSIFKSLTSHLYFILTKPAKYLKALRFSLQKSSGIGGLFFFYLNDVLSISKTVPDHIHAHFGKQASNLAMLINILTGIPFTFTTHGYDIYIDPPENYRIKSQLAKMHITISEFNKSFLISNFDVDKDKIIVIHCGIDTNQFYPRYEGEKDNTIISIARLVERKGLDTLIKACKLLESRGIKFECLIAGEGDKRNDLIGLIKDLSLDNSVRLLGNRTQNEIFDLLAVAKIAVLASRSEGIPISLMEAMASGVPVIGTAVNGTAELIENGKSGFLIEPDNAKILAQRIEELISQKNMREFFIKNALEHIKLYFNLAAETEKLINVWNS